MRLPVVTTWLLALTLPLSPGCGHEAEGTDNDHDHDHAEHDHDHGEGHAHSPSYGGALVVLAEEFAHMELLVDTESGEVTAWAFGPHAENHERLAQETIELTVQGPDGPFLVNLSAVAKATTGETVGDTSQFDGQDDRLIGLEEFEASFGPIESRGRAFPSTAFPYPAGNDPRAAVHADHDHDHEGEHDHDHEGEHDHDHAHDDGHDDGTD